jgi:hypothetical protein
LLRVPASDRLIVATFAEWRIFRRSRIKAERDKLTDSSIKWAQARIRVAAAFLGWLTGRSKTLEAVTQSDVDLWLTETPMTTRYVIRDFLVWTNRRKYTYYLKAPQRPSGEPALFVDDDERWKEIEHLLADRTLRNEVRLIALLSLIFAQQVSRICRLSNALIADRRNDVFITFGRDPVKMPPALAVIVRHQLEAALTNPKSLRPDGARWLFPGGHFGAHVSPSAVQRSLTRIGIKSRPTRNSALMSLAAQLQAGIVASAFGLHVNTAIAWADAAGATFNRHVARRSLQGQRRTGRSKSTMRFR